MTIHRSVNSTSITWDFFFFLINFLKGDNQKTCKKSLKIPKGQSEYVYRRRTENAMAKRKNTKGQTTIHKTYI